MPQASKPKALELKTSHTRCVSFKEPAKERVLGVVGNASQMIFVSTVAPRASQPRRQEKDRLPGDFAGFSKLGFPGGKGSAALRP